MIHVRLTYMQLKKLELVLVIFLKEIAKYADTCTAAQVDLSLSVGLWVHSNCRKLCAIIYIKYPSPL